MVPRSILITGSSRGIGLELVKQIAGLDPGPQLILAACRTPETAQELKTLEKQYSSVKVIKLDVESEESIQAAYKETCDLVGKDGLNVLVNNAAINLKQQSICDVTSKELLQTLKVNVVAPVIVTKTFLPLLQTAAAKQDGGMSWSRAAIINISSKLGSIGENVNGGYYQYRESKAALNQLTKNLCIELSPKGILATCIHPGWVRTDMGGPNATLGKEGSVKGMIEVFQSMNSDSAGKLLTYNGQTLQW